MTRETSMAELVETIVDASAALEKWSATKDAIRTLSAARRIASAAATIVSRLKGFGDEELAGWVAQVDRALAREKETRDQ